MIRFSFIVATYQYGRYLRRAIDSILAQEGDDFEVIIVDDGSTDDTSTIVAGYGERVRSVVQRHAGLFTACRNGERSAKGRYLLFVDADDRLRPGALRALREAADGNPDAVVILGRTCSIAEDGASRVHRLLELSPSPIENFERFCRDRLRASIAGALIDRRWLTPFDRDEFSRVHGPDRAVFGAALMRGLVQIDTVTLDVFAHANRLRDNLSSIRLSGDGLSRMLFESGVLPSEALRFRDLFEATRRLALARAYRRAGRHSDAGRNFFAAFGRYPLLAFGPRDVLRAAHSAVLSFVGVDEGPVERVDLGLRALFRDETVDPYAAFLGVAAGHLAVARLADRRPTYFLREPEDARHVLIHRAEAYAKTAFLRLFPILAGGMIGMNEPEHRRHRDLLKDRVGRVGVEEFAPTMIDVVDRRVAALDGAPEQDVGSLCLDVVVEAAARFVLGTYDPTAISELMRLLRRAHQNTIERLRGSSWWPKWIGPGRLRRYAKIERRLDSWLREHAPAPGGKDVASFLTTCAGFADVRARRDPLLMIFIAAFEPVAVILTQGFRLLADHPEIQRRIADEFGRVVGARRPSAPEIRSLKFTGRVVDELLRLHPNEWMLSRRATEEDRLPSGVRIRRGAEVMISPYTVHRDPRFYRDPERFDPDRVDTDPPRPIGAYFPFGAGSRACLGEPYARLLLTLMIGRVVSARRLSPIAAESPPIFSPGIFSTHLVASPFRLRAEVR